jgi:hypothetical protein
MGVLATPEPPTPQTDVAVRSHGAAAGTHRQTTDGDGDGARRAVPARDADHLSAVLARSRIARPGPKPEDLGNGWLRRPLRRMLQRFAGANPLNGTLNTAAEIADAQAAVVAYNEIQPIANALLNEITALIAQRTHNGQYAANPVAQLTDQATRNAIVTKCLAVGGPAAARVVTMSGWSHGASVVAVPNPAGGPPVNVPIQAGGPLTTAVIAANAALADPFGMGFGYTPTVDPARDWYVPGRFVASHAEKQAAIIAPNHPIGVRWNMCPDCITWFRMRSMVDQRVRFVADPVGLHLFDENCGHWRRPLATAGAAGFVRLA